MSMRLDRTAGAVVGVAGSTECARGWWEEEPQSGGAVGVALMDEGGEGMTFGGALEAECGKARRDDDDPVPGEETEEVGVDKDEEAEEFEDDEEDLDEDEDELDEDDDEDALDDEDDLDDDEDEEDEIDDEDDEDDDGLGDGFDDEDDDDDDDL